MIEDEDDDESEEEMGRQDRLQQQLKIIFQVSQPTQASYHLDNT